MKKNGRLYGRSYQSSQITPGSLQQSLLLTPPIPAQAPPQTHITASPSLLSTPSLTLISKPSVTPNITTSNSTPKLAQTTHTNTSITTSFFEPVTFPKQLSSRKRSSIKKSSCITILKRDPPTLEILPFRDI